MYVDPPSPGFRAGRESGPAIDVPVFFKDPVEHLFHHGPKRSGISRFVRHVVTRLRHEYHLHTGLDQPGQRISSTNEHAESVPLRLRSESCGLSRERWRRWSNALGEKPAAESR